MIAWEPRDGGKWHLKPESESYLSLCGVRVAGLGRFTQRDPHKIDKNSGEQCPKCWTEWRLRTGASLARQDQHFAEQEGEG